MTPRYELDLDRLRNEKVERGCMSERHLDAQGVLRLMRFAPTTLVPGAVFKVFHAPTPNGEPPHVAPEMEERAEQWRDSTAKWLRACEEQGEGIAASSKEIEEWVARAEALLPADGGPDPHGTNPLSPDLVASCKRMLAAKCESEKQEKKNRLERHVDRLYVVKENPLNGTARTERRSTACGLAERNLRAQTYRFGNRKLDQTPTFHLNDAVDFRTALLRKHENLLQAWDQLDTNSNGLIDFREFVNICRKIQMTGKLHEIFHELSSDGINLRLTDLDPSLKEEQERREQQHENRHTKRTNSRQVMHLPLLKRLTMTVERSQSELFDQEAVRSFSKERMPPPLFRSCTDTSVEYSRPARSSVISTVGEVEYMMTHGYLSDGHSPCTAKDILGSIVRNYGSVEAGWNDLDRNGNGVLCFQEFVLGCRKMQVRGNMRQMFKDLCSDGGHELKMTDVAPHLREEQERRMQEAQERKRKNHDKILEQDKMWRQNTALSRENLADRERESPRHRRHLSQSSNKVDVLPAIPDGREVGASLE